MGAWLAIMLVGAAPAGQLGAPASRLAVIKQAPDFTLLDQDRKELRLTDLTGKVLLVSFIFTTCNGTCPATTHRVAQVQAALHAGKLTQDGRVRLLSITLDPVRDTPEVLKAYMRLYDADAGDWSFLTGSPDPVAKTIASWGMWVRPGANGQLDHPSRIFLVDPRGRIREIYNLNFLKPRWVLEDMKLLLAESKPNDPG
jgi:protein SCO1/2